jgi:uracil-DNA glycosylase
MKSQLKAHLLDLKECKNCPDMVGPVVTHIPILSKVYLLGQAPGPHEGKFGKPFAWTAGKTLFRWFSTIGLDEEQFRNLVYMAAVCRCFPGKASGGGDRVPSPFEIKTCSSWIKAEFTLLKPKLVIPVGKLAIEQCLESVPLIERVGQQFRKDLYGIECDIIPLPHPSGASTWYKRDPGKTLLTKALEVISKHLEWQKLLSEQNT